MQTEQDVQKSLEITSQQEPTRVRELELQIQLLQLQLQQQQQLVCGYFYFIMNVYISKYCKFYSY